MVRYTAARMPVPASWRTVGAVALAALLTACAAPPTRELSIAQGAIDAARAAGAAEFAAEELAGAEATLARAQTAVGERDYRAALGHALDAHTLAQAAARSAAEGRVRARLAADERLDAFARRIEQVEVQLAGPEAKRVPAAARRGAATTIAHALAVLKAARTALDAGDLTAVAPIAAETAALDRVQGTLTPPPPTRPRPRR